MSFPGTNAKMEVKKKTPNAQRLTFNAEFRQAFTLIELLVVISIIIVLMGLLFPAFRGVQDQAKKTQAKNDLTQIVTAVNAYYTEYGKYPVADSDQGAEKTFAASNKQLLDILQSIPGNDPSPTDATVNKYNLRKIVFLQPPSVKSDTAGSRRSGVSTADGNFYDPWGNIYQLRIDSDYDSQVSNPYGVAGGAGSDPIRQGAVIWSFGKDTQPGNKGDNIFKDASGVQSDDVISWQ
jgi:prepilin-type N-terminal cleavage/methylation domain-containing protein